MATTPMFAPDGTLGDVPQERVADATKAGFKPGQELISPKGEMGVVPIDRVVDAMRSGFMPKSMANMPGSPSMQPMMQKSNLGIAAGSENTERSAIANPQQPAEQFALEHPEQQGSLATSAGIGAAGTAAVAAAPVAIPAIKSLAMRHPIIATMLASEAISQARNIPYVGKMIPPYSEMIPMLLGGKGGKPVEGSAPPETIWDKPVETPSPVQRPVPRWQTQQQLPEGFNPTLGTRTPSPVTTETPPISNRTVYPQPKPPRPAPAWQTNPQPVQEFTLQGSTPEEIQAQLSRMANRPRTMRPEGETVEQSPYQVQNIPVQGVKAPQGQGQPNLPEMQPAQSTTISQHGYDPAKQQMFVQFKNGNVYRYSGVPQKVYDQYSASESQGSFHAQQIKGRYQTDLVGKVKPTPGQKVSQALGGQQ